MAGEERNSFDKLVAGLDSSDRQALLDRINQAVPQSVHIDDQKSVSRSEGLETLQHKLHGESIFYKIYLFIRSVFTQSSTEQLYSHDILMGMAKKINSQHPGIINPKQKVLDYIFYERLQSLKDAADFFKPYFSFINDATGDFYVFLSSFVAPEFAAQVDSEANPFNVPFNSQLPSDVKVDLSNKLSELLRNIDPGVKAKIYAGATSVNWLKRFTELSFIHFMSQFTNITGGDYTCPYVSARTDLNEFAAVLSNAVEIDSVILEAIYLFSQRKNLNENVQDKDIERAVKEFLSMALIKINSIQSFLENVPLIRIGRVVNDSYDWQPGGIGGAEGWFASFKTRWEKIFELKWNDWLKEQKKYNLSDGLNKDFGLQEFPVMKYRPWMNIWNLPPFACELTGGFLSWFSQEKYKEMIVPLNIIATEGVFVRSENREEYSEGLHNFSTANTLMGEVLERLSPKGDYGRSFKEYEDSVAHTMQSQKQLDNMMKDTEKSVREIMSLFCKGGRSMERVFHGFFDNDKDGIHESLQNLSQLMAHENKSFKGTFINLRDSLKSCLFYLSELEPIDAGLV